MKAVTSFSEKGYKLYGKTFLKSFLKHWPGDLTVYYESKPDFEDESIHYRDFFKIPHVKTFLKTIQHVPYSNGYGPKGYDYNLDADKFLRKVFVQCDFIKERCYWLDADIVFKKKIPERFLEDLFEDAGLIFMGRKGFHTESGVVGFDPSVRGFDEFKTKYLLCLQKGIIFTLPGWHDCYALDWARSYKDVKEKDLSPDWTKDQGLYVLKRTVLHEYLVHYKGNLKTSKRKREYV